MKEVNRHLERLIKKVRKGDIVLWAGAGFSLYAGIPSGKDLCNAIIDEVSSSEKEILKEKSPNLPEVAGEYVKMRNGSKTDLYNILENEININYKDITYHKNITQIPQIKTIITTNFDKIFEEAYDNSRLHTIIQGKSIPVANREVELYKIHGDIEYPESIIITRSDYDKFFTGDDYDSLWNKVKTIAFESSILFIGYSFEDPNIESLFDKTIEKLGRFHNECFLVAPDWPEYKQIDLAKKHIQYINMTTEQILPLISEEVRKNLIRDSEKGFVNPRKTVEILNRNNIKASFSINSDTGIKFTSIDSKERDTFIKGKLKVDFPQDGKKKERFYRFINGESFDEVVLDSNIIKKFNTSYEGIDLPIGDNFEEYGLKMQSIPAKEKDVSLVLKNSSRMLDNVKVFVYLAKSKIKIVYNISGIEIILYHDLKNNDNKLTFRNKNISNVIKGKKIFCFLKEWVEGVVIKIIHEEDYMLEFPNVKKDFKNDDYINELREIINSYNTLYNNLIKIQNYFEIKINVPEIITEKDLDKLKDILIYINGDIIKVNDVCFEIEIIDKQQFFNKIYKENSFTFRATTKEKEIKNIFNKKFELGYGVIEAKDAYCKNIDEIRKLYDRGKRLIPLTIESKSDSLTFQYIDMIK